jgi:hypothetical protein
MYPEPSAMQASHLFDIRETFNRQQILIQLVKTAQDQADHLLFRTGRRIERIQHSGTRPQHAYIVAARRHSRCWGRLINRLLKTRCGWGRTRLQQGCCAYSPQR